MGILVLIVVAILGLMIGDMTGIVFLIIVAGWLGITLWLITSPLSVLMVFGLTILCLIVKGNLKNR